MRANAHARAHTHTHKWHARSHENRCKTLHRSSIGCIFKTSSKHGTIRRLGAFLHEEKRKWIAFSVRDDYQEIRSLQHHPVTPTPLNYVHFDNT